MKILRTKTHILTIFFLIIFNQLLSIVSATRSAHPDPPSANKTQKPPPKQSNTEPQMDSPVLEKNQNRNQNQAQKSHPNPFPQNKDQPAAKRSQNNKIISPLNQTETNGNQSDEAAESTPSEKWNSQDFVTAHNKYRQKLGHPALIWDEKLAQFARSWANTRRADCEIVHSKKEYGENIFRGHHDGQWTPTEVVEKWEEEEKFYDRKSGKCDKERECGHYTQVIWRTTERIGCGKCKCDNGSLMVVCSYNPPGNLEGSSPFALPQKSIPGTGSLTPTGAPSFHPIPTDSKKKHA